MAKYLKLALSFTELSRKPTISKMEIVGLGAKHKHAIVDAEQARWLDENQDAIDYYNAFVEEHGLFGDEFRPF